MNGLGGVGLDGKGGMKRLTGGVVAAVHSHCDDVAESSGACGEAAGRQRKKLIRRLYRLFVFEDEIEMLERKKEKQDPGYCTYKMPIPKIHNTPSFASANPPHTIGTGQRQQDYTSHAVSTPR